MPFSILVHVGSDLVGDGLMKVPFVRALRAGFPQAHICWLAGQGPTVYAGKLAPLVEGLLDEVVSQDLDGFVRERRAAGMVYDIVIDTQRGFWTAWRLRRLRPRKFVAPATGFVLSSVRPKRGYRKPKSLVRQLMDLVELAGGGASATSDAPLHIPAAIADEAARLLPAGPTYVGLSPGAGGRHKCWPLDNYIELGRRLAISGIQPVVFLGPGEAEWADAVRAGLPGAMLPEQDTKMGSPLLTIAMGQRLAAAVANDSGVGHMMAAAAIPLVSLFGPTPPDKFAPMTEILHIIRAQEFGATEMEAIPVEAVEAALHEILPVKAPAAVKAAEPAKAPEPQIA